MIYIGLDVHKVNTTVAWLDNETGDSSSFLTRQLKSCGREVMVVDAHKSHRLGEARHTAKTHKLDAAVGGLAAGGRLAGDGGGVAA